MTRGQVYAGKAVILIEAIDKIDNTLKSVENKFKRMGNNLSAMGRTTFTGGFFGSAGSASLLYRFSQFDDLILELRVKMGLLNKVSREQEQQFSALEKRIRTLGRTTSYTAKQVAEGAISLAQAGFSNSEIENSLQAVLDLARGTRTELDMAARTMSNTIRTFNLDTATSNELVSQFVKAARLGTVELDDLAESLKYASATSVQLGQSLPAILAIFTLLSEKGMRGSIAGTSLNTAFSQMAKKSSDIAKNMGFNVPVDQNGNLMFIETLKLLDEATKKMNKLDRMRVFGDIFNLRGTRAVLPIASDDEIEQLIQLTLSISEASDEARQAAIVMDSGLGGSTRRAISALDDLNISLQKTLQEGLMPLLEVVPILANAIDKFAAKYQGLTLLLLASPGIALGAGAGMIVLGKALQVVGKGASLAKAGLSAITPMAGKGMLPAAMARMGSPKMPGFLGKFPTGAASAVPGGITMRQAGKQNWLRQMSIRMAEMQLADAAPRQSFERLTASNIPRTQKDMAKHISSLEMAKKAADRKMLEAAKKGDVRVATREGEKAKRIKDQIAAAKNRPTTVPFVSADNLIANANKTRAANNVADGARMARRATTEQLALAKAIPKLSSTKSAGILPQILSGIGKSGGIAKNILTLSGGILSLGKNIAKFAFSANGAMIIFQVLLMFGDRIPVIKDALKNLGSAFSAFGAHIMSMGQALKPVFTLMGASFGALGNQDTADLGFAGLVDSFSLLAEVVGGKLRAAFAAFKAELGWVWDTLKQAVVVGWELVNVIFTLAVNAIGNVLGGVFERLEGSFQSIMSMFSGEGGVDFQGIFKVAITGLATIVAELFNWVSYAVIQLNSMFQIFVNDLEQALLRVLSNIPGVGGKGSMMEVNQEIARQMGVNLRQARDKDLAGNETAMNKFREAIQTVMYGDAAKEGKLAEGQAMSEVNQSMNSAWNRFDLLLAQLNQRQGQLAAEALGAGGGGTQSIVANPIQQIQEVKAALQGFAATLVGSGVATRGNVTRAVTETELKKQTGLLEDIKVEMETMNTRSGNVFKL